MNENEKLHNAIFAYLGDDAELLQIIRDNHNNKEMLEILSNIANGLQLLEKYLINKKREENMSTMLLDEPQTKTIKSQIDPDTIHIIIGAISNLKHTTLSFQTKIEKYTSDTESMLSR